ncbi:uncharacterized protein LOC143200024 [Rhynchophorus ferrugineus]|uniref:Uncharacterized protein n=1 Tax=Rhynchophorus ferrugineus TaxID=354439 RepID=A0A834HZD1_RHYFE|nr:hypothetical protein GWI33_015701 [Rhynchophorus ferrugineus]
MASMNERRIRDVRDIWTMGSREATDKDAGRNAAVPDPAPDTRTRHKYKTLERHLSMKKTIRKKMMRDLREIGDGTTDQQDESQHAAFLEQIKNDQPPPESVEKPSLWRRLTKGWGH